MTKDDLLLYDNARPHSAAATFEATRRLKFDLLPRHSYRSDLRRGQGGGGWDGQQKWSVSTLYKTTWANFLLIYICSYLFIML